MERSLARGGRKRFGASSPCFEVDLSGGEHGD
jgi:hypothetical protein